MPRSNELRLQQFLFKDALSDLWLVQFQRPRHDQICLPSQIQSIQSHRQVSCHWHEAREEVSNRPAKGCNTIRLGWCEPSSSPEVKHRPDLRRRPLHH